MGMWRLPLCALCAFAFTVGTMAAEDGGGAQPLDAKEFGGSLEPQQILVTATRIPTPAENVPDSVSVFSTEAGDGTRFQSIAETRQYRGLTDVLRNTPGVSVDSSGGPGGVTGVYTRGLDSGRTLLLQDGMQLNDPSSIDGSFDFSWMTLDNIDQVEILRGPQSSLYGSGASGGVISLRQRKGEGPFSGHASVEAGSRGSVLTRLGSQAGTDKIDYSFAGSVFHTDGISMIDKKYGNRERDSLDKGNLSLRLGGNPTDMLRLDLFANVLRSEVELDWDPSPGYPSWGIPPHNGDDPYYKQKIERHMIRPEATLSLFGGNWDHTIGFGYVRTERKLRDEEHETNGYWADGGRTRYLGETAKFDYQSVLRLHETNTLLAGVDVIDESMEYQSVYYGPNRTPTVSPGSVTTVGAYIEDRINIRDVFIATAGVRREHHENFGGKTTWKTGAMYVLPTDTKIKASAGTGFKAPSIYQLHIGYVTGGIYDTLPNSGLDPENSFGWDVGFEQSLWGERVNFGATFFRNKVKNKVGAVSIDPSNPNEYRTRYENIGLYRTWGVESFVEIKITDSLILSGQYTWTRTDTEDNLLAGNTRQLYRRPLNEATVNLDWLFCGGRGTVTAGMKYVGRRIESYVWDASLGASNRMPSYAVARIGASWKVTDRVKIFGRVENLFDRKYQEVYGYGTEGISVFGGVALSF